MSTAYRILVIGDPHFKTTNQEETLILITKTLEYIDVYEPQLVVILGDLLDRHEQMHMTPHSSMSDFLLRLSTKVLTYALIGNHDIKNNQQYLTRKHGFVGVGNPNLVIVDHPRILSTPIGNIAFVPYVPPGRLMEALSTLNTDNIFCEPLPAVQAFQVMLDLTRREPPVVFVKPREPSVATPVIDWNQHNIKCVFAHQELAGVNTGLHDSVDGDVWGNDYPLIISGHIHERQLIRDNIFYPGTPYQHDFGASPDKSMSLISLYADRVPTNSNLDEIRLNLNIIKKLTVDITWDQVATYVPPENCTCRIRISGTKAEINTVMVHPNVDIWKRQGHKPQPVETASTEIINVQTECIPRVKFSTMLKEYFLANPDVEIIYQEAMRMQ